MIEFYSKTDSQNHADTYLPTFSYLDGSTNNNMFSDELNGDFQRSFNAVPLNFNRKRSFELPKPNNSPVSAMNSFSIGFVFHLIYNEFFIPSKF